MAAIVSNLRCELRCNIRMRPTVYGLRLKAGALLCRVAAWIMNGKLEIEPEMTASMTGVDGSVIFEETTKL